MITFILDDEKFEGLPNFSIETFNSNELFKEETRCWFNDEFSMILHPRSQTVIDWSLVVNK